MEELEHKPSSEMPLRAKVAAGIMSLGVAGMAYGLFAPNFKGHIETPIFRYDHDVTHDEGAVAMIGGGVLLFGGQYAMFKAAKRQMQQDQTQ